MQTSKNWITYFKANAEKTRINWDTPPSISQADLDKILSSLQAWQLGETSDGKHLIKAASIHAAKYHDPEYVDAIKLFIKEEQKHGNNLGKYLDLVNKPRIKKDWGDTLFRKIRYYNTNMEIWTVAVITVESAAQIFYQCLKDATTCTLLKEICTDILIDEAAHIDFQKERLTLIFERKSSFLKTISRLIYPIFFFSTAIIIWLAHRKVFIAGNANFKGFVRRMRFKHFKTLYRIAKDYNRLKLLPYPS